MIGWDERWLRTQYTTDPKSNGSIVFSIRSAPKLGRKRLRKLNKKVVPQLGKYAEFNS